MKKIKNKILVIFLMAGISMLLTHCKKNQKTVSYTQKIHAPFAGYDVPFQEYTFHQDSGIMIERPTGTMIKIEAGSFEKNDGSVISGPVSLKVREFHNASEILQSGIPMSQDSLRNNFLQSAGMIELRAFSNGEELNLKKNKSIDIELAGFKASEGYQLYHLEDNKNWMITEKFTSTENKRKKTKMEKIISFISTPFKKKENPEDIIFNLVGNVKEAPYLKDLQTQKWKVSGKNVTPEVEEAMRINWDEVKVVVLDKKKKRYALNFSTVINLDYKNKFTKKISVEASPVLDEKNQNAQDEFDKDLKNYEATLQKMEEEKTRVMQEADMVNSFKINKMGIWNVDKIMNTQGFVEAEVSFDFEKNIDPIVNNITLFTIYEDENSVIKYLPGDWKKIKFQANKKMTLIAVLPNNKIAKVESADIEKMVSSSGRKYYFSTIKTDANSYFKKNG